MGETIALGLLLLLKKALDSALEKGLAISAAAVKRDEKFHCVYHVTDWDSRCKHCLTKENDEENKGEG